MDDAFGSQLEDAYNKDDKDDEKHAEILRLVNSLEDGEWGVDDSSLEARLDSPPFEITVYLVQLKKKGEPVRRVRIHKKGRRPYGRDFKSSELPMPKKIIEKLVALADEPSSFPPNGDREPEEDTSYHGRDIVTGF
jgi:hypothetical protein